MSWAAAAQIGIQLLGEMKAGQERGKATGLTEDMLARIRALKNPEMERAVFEMLQSDEGQIEADPAMVAAQQAALARLGQIADDGGYSLESQAVQNRIRGDTARHESAGRNQIRNSMAARGVGGSGAELAMQLAGNQASAERVSEEGMTAAGQAQKAAYQALMGQGELAGRMRSQGFNEQSSAARARDMMRKYNATAKDRALSYNNGLAQGDFTNSLAKLTGQVGVNNALAGQYNANGVDARQQAGSYGYAAREAFKDPNEGTVAYEPLKYTDGRDVTKLREDDDEEDYYTSGPLSAGF